MGGLKDAWDKDWSIPIMKIVGVIASICTTVIFVALTIAVVRYVLAGEP